MSIKRPARLRRSLILATVSAVSLLALTGCAAQAATGGSPGGQSSPLDTQNPQNVSAAIQILLLVTVMSVAPAILIMVTSFTRVIVVLSLVRSAIGIPSLPPNQVLIGLALFLTAFVMAPAIKTINNEALSVAQTGLVLSGSQITPKLNNLNPAKGFKKIISADGLVSMVKSIAKMAVISIVVWMTMSARMAEIVSLGQLAPSMAAGRLAALSFSIAIRAGVVLFILALADFAWQRRKWIKSLMMSKEDVRQESRETEGDPQIKAAIRRRRQQLMNRMIAAVPKADVVVTNPTHYAVAIKYDPLTMQAPQVAGPLFLSLLEGVTSSE